LSRINDKIKDIERYLSELQDIVPLNFEEYSADITKKAACERYIQKIAEAVVDLAFLILNLKNIKTPEDDASVFEVLKENSLIKESLSKKLKQAKGMRNFISHQYDKIDDNLVFDAVKKELEKDVNEFIKEVRKCL